MEATHVKINEEEEKDDKEEDTNRSEDDEIIIAETANDNSIDSDKDVPDSFLRMSTAVVADSQETCSPAK